MKARMSTILRKIDKMDMKKQILLAKNLGSKDIYNLQVL